MTPKEKAQAEQDKIKELVAKAQSLVSALELEPADYVLTGDSAELEAIIADLEAKQKEIADAADDTDTETDSEKDVVKQPTMVELQKAGRKNFIHAQKKAKEAEAKK